MQEGNFFWGGDGLFSQNFQNVLLNKVLGKIRHQFSLRYLVATTVSRDQDNKPGVINKQGQIVHKTGVIICKQGQTVHKTGVFICQQGQTVHETVGYL